jgi:hypothetical protein
VTPLDDGPTEPADDGDGKRASTEATRPADETVVETASDAAEGLVLSRYRRSAVRDLFVTVSFEAGVLDVDVYLDAPADEHDPERVAEAAARAARSAVDELFEDGG